MLRLRLAILCAEAIRWRRGGFIGRFSAVPQDRFVVPPRDAVLLWWFLVGGVAFVVFPGLAVLPSKQPGSKKGEGVNVKNE